MLFLTFPYEVIYQKGYIWKELHQTWTSFQASVFIFSILEEVSDTNGILGRDLMLSVTSADTSNFGIYPLLELDRNVYLYSPDESLNRI